MVFADVIGVINNTNTKDSLLAYEIVYSVCLEGKRVFYDNHRSLNSSIGFTNSIS